MQTRANGAVKQSSTTSQMVFSPVFLVAYISRMMTLLPGDLILTGTAGIAPSPLATLSKSRLREWGRC